MKVYYSKSRDALYKVYSSSQGNSGSIEALYGVKRSTVITKDYYGDEFELPEDVYEVRVPGFSCREYFDQLWRIARAYELMSLNKSPEGLYSKECQRVLDVIKDYKHNFVSLF